MERLTERDWRGSIYVERIVSLEQLSHLMAPYLKRKHVTNNFTLPSAYLSLIGQERLFFIESESLFLFADIDNYYRFYYHLDDAKGSFNISVDKPCVAEVAFRNGELPAEIASGCLIKSGFSEKVKRLRMKTAMEGFSVELQPGSLENLRMEEACLRSADEVMGFLQANFDLFTGFLPSGKDLGASIEGKEVLCAWDKSGKKLLGVLHFNIVKKNANLLHIAVSKDARKGGIGQALLARWKEASGERGAENYTLWVNCDNGAAIGLYEKAGFKDDSLRSLTLLHD
jgi:ribosomal protein S18 acetylase RimI-like enzyme